MEYNVSLKEMNSFHLDCKAEKFIRVKEEKDLERLSEYYGKEKIYILGSGSNTLFVKQHYDGIVARIENKGLRIIAENEDDITVEVSSGQVWNDFVEWVCKNNYSGVENLAAVPSSVGAVPVQNIGAYGSEAKDVIDKVLVYDLEKKEFKYWTNEDCDFGYRYSKFKYQKGNLVIWKVVFKLQKHFVLNNSYKALKDKLESSNQTIITPKLVAQIVTEIRNSKLPNPEILGNVGSFFKNPIITKEQYERLQTLYPNIVAFDDEKGKKISAGWLIEQCGYKGKRIGNVGVYEKQALIVVNYSNASGKELLDFSNAIIETVKDKFDIILEPEVHIVK